jgi:hypothetical protein
MQKYASKILSLQFIFTSRTIIARKMSGFALSPRIFAVDRFGLRQFNDSSYMGTKITSMSPDEFEQKVNELYETGKFPLVDGYAPFCKHLFVPNFVDAKCDYALITDENKHLIESDYVARQAGELAVLSRWFDKSRVPAPDASFLDIILYSRDQIILENAAMQAPPPEYDSPWGIICVKGQMCDFELPMQPITMMRNALGREEGGSGVPLKPEEYEKSVAFWKKHCSIK